MIKPIQQVVIKPKCKKCGSTDNKMISSFEEFCYNGEMIKECNICGERFSSPMEVKEIEQK